MAHNKLLLYQLRTLSSKCILILIVTALQHMSSEILQTFNLPFGKLAWNSLRQALKYPGNLVQQLLKNNSFWFCNPKRHWVPTTVIVYNVKFVSIKLTDCDILPLWKSRVEMQVLHCCCCNLHWVWVSETKLLEMILAQEPQLLQAQHQRTIVKSIVVKRLHIDSQTPMSPQS